MSYQEFILLSQGLPLRVIYSTAQWWQWCIRLKLSIQYMACVLTAKRMSRNSASLNMAGHKQYDGTQWNLTASTHQWAESLSGQVLTTFTSLHVFTERLPWAMTQSCLYEGQSKPILVSKFTAYGWERSTNVKHVKLSYHLTDAVCCMFILLDILCHCVDSLSILMIGLHNTFQIGMG